MPSIYERITQFNKGRLPDILKIKYHAMSRSAFSFYRGSCHLFYEDLSSAAPLPASPTVWLCGDLHPENFGSFKGDDQQEYFDLNDFDEGILGPALWEVTRMVTGIFVGFDSLALRKTDAEKTAQLFLDTYSNVLSKGKALIIDPRTACGVVQEFLIAVKKRKQKELLRRLAVAKKGKFVKLAIDARHLMLDEKRKGELVTFVSSQIADGELLSQNYKVLDCVFRLAGTGSMGVKRYLFLLKRTDVKGKYLFLDMKQAMPSSLQPYVTAKQPEFKSLAARVIAIQQRMQHVSPALLGSVIYKKEPYILKQMQPIADKINFAEMEDKGEDIGKVIRDMAALTASAQLRSGGREGSAIADELIVFGANEQWQKAVLSYAQRYATQVKNDCQEFIAALAKNAGQ